MRKNEDSIKFVWRDCRATVNGKFGVALFFVVLAVVALAVVALPPW